MRADIRSTPDHDDARLDWLAFAHLVLALVFIGPLRDPVRNIWVVTFGLWACAAILPLAFIAGAVRGIPVYWRLIDCSFGVGGALLLWPCRQAIIALEAGRVTRVTLAPERASASA